MKDKFSNLFIFLIFISCKNTTSEISEKLIKNSNNEVFISLVKDCHTLNEKSFDLTNDEVNQINKILPKAIQKMEQDFAFIEPKGKFKIDLSQYKRQYCAYITKNGEKEVYVNCLCEVKNDSWKNEMYDVLGGGKCYFSGVINLTTNKFYDFNVNAPL